MEGGREWVDRQQTTRQAEHESWRSWHKHEPCITHAQKPAHVGTCSEVSSIAVRPADTNSSQAYLGKCPAQHHKRSTPSSTAEQSRAGL
jgi:hypothetical protein